MYAVVDVVYDVNLFLLKWGAPESKLWVLTYIDTLGISCAISNVVTRGERLLIARCNKLRGKTPKKR